MESRPLPRWKGKRLRPQPSDAELLAEVRAIVADWRRQPSKSAGPMRRIAVLLENEGSANRLTDGHSKE